MRKITLFAILTLVVMGFVGCTGSESPVANAAVKEDGSKGVANSKELEAVPVNVKVEPVILTTLTESVVANGQTLADKDVTYSAENAGKVEYLAVDLGATVKKGKVLARIDYKMQKAQQEQAQAAYELAQKTFERLNALRSEELISQQQIDEAQNAMTQARAQKTIADVNFSRSVVRAVSKGVVVKKFVEKGEYVGPGSPIFTIVDYSTITVEAQIPETQVAKVKTGMNAKVSIDSLDEEFNGVVDVVIPSSDSVSKTFGLRVKVPNPDGKIFVGMAARINAISDVHENVVVVPQEVVVEELNKRFVFVIEDKYAKKIDVELGPSEGYKVVVVKGLKPNDKLVVLGQRDLVNKQLVRIIQ